MACRFCPADIVGNHVLTGELFRAPARKEWVQDQMMFSMFNCNWHSSGVFIFQHCQTIFLSSSAQYFAQPPAVLTYWLARWSRGLDMIWLRHCTEISLTDWLPGFTGYYPGTETSPTQPSPASLLNIFTFLGGENTSLAWLASPVPIKRSQICKLQDWLTDWLLVLIIIMIELQSGAGKLKVLRDLYGMGRSRVATHLRDGR